MPTLLVIDMQPRFKASRRKWLIRNVSAEIRAAMKAKHRIVFLEHTRQHERPGVVIQDATDRRLTKLVDKYPKALVIHKQRSGGSAEVVNLLESLKHGYPDAIQEKIQEEIRVVGVNTSCCVALTVNGMAEKMPKASIIVVGKACNEGEGYGQGKPGNSGLENINDQPNITIMKVKVKAA